MRELSYKFWSKIVFPFDWILRGFGYYIIFSYTDQQKDVFDKFHSMYICHESKLNGLNK